MKERIILFVFIDAFGHEIMLKHNFLPDTLPFRQPLETILGYSCTCDPVILTGKLPRETGHFSFFRYAPDESPFRFARLLKILPASIMDRGRVRHHVSRLLRWKLGYTGYFQIYNMPFRYLPFFDYTEKRDLYAPSGINSGLPTIFDYLRQSRIPFSLSDWRRSESWNIGILRSHLEQGEVDFAYLYMASLDAVLHAKGTQAPEVDEKLAWYDSQLRSILDVASKKYAHVDLVVFSDHGMTDITEICDLMAAIDRTGLKFAVDYAAVYDSTMARFWFLKNGVRETIEGALAEVHQGKVLTNSELHEYGCDFPDHQYGELIFLLNPGVLLCPSFMGLRPLKGMHGFTPDDPASKAVLMSNFEVPQTVRRLDDLYSLMRMMLDQNGIVRKTR